MLTFLTPSGALIGIAVVVPLVALAAGARRVDAVRAALGLRGPRTVMEITRPGALVATFAALALAGTQPALSHDTAQRVRSDAQVLFVLDTSRSMAAASGPRDPTRLARAEAAAARLRASIPAVESGIATLTDRVLPDLLPVPDVASFEATLERSVGIERPPPRSSSVRATTYAALSGIGSSGFFGESAKRRVVVLLTDGESAPFDPGAVAASLGSIRLVIVRVSRAGESIAGEPSYRPDPAAPATLGTLASATGGKIFGEGDVGGAAAATRTDLGTGPTARVRARTRRETALAPYVALAALAPLAFFLRRRPARQEYD